MKKMTKILLVSLLCTAYLGAAQPGLDFSFAEPEELVIHNRVLLKIKGKPLTVMDVVKKMDLLFYRQYPELASNQVAKYQFYSNAWRSILSGVIDDALIMADAEEKKVEITDGEIREELEALFGPDVVLNLDKLGMTLPEALELLKTELTVQRMTGMMVHSRALTEAHPKKIREKYQAFLEKNPPSDTWVYQVLSIRGKNHEESARQAYEALNQNVPFDKVLSQLKEEGVQVSLSEEYQRAEKDLSLSHKGALQAIGTGLVSTPSSTQDVSRLFVVKKFEKGVAIPFKEMENKLKQEIVSKAVDHYNEVYREGLRTHYGLSSAYLKEVIPDTIKPFAMR